MNKNILLKPVNKDDAEFIYSAANNKELMEIFCDGQSSLEEWSSAIDIWNEDDDEKVFIIVREKDGVHIGWVGVNGLLSEDNSAWIKMIAILPEFWGQGYGSEVIHKVKQDLLKEGFSKIYLWTDKCNKRAQACYKKNGFDIIKEEKSIVGSLSILRDRVMMEYTEK